MKFWLVFALTIASFLLLMIGERLGLPAPVAAMALGLIVLIALLGLALDRATTRLARYHFGGHSGGGMAFAAVLGSLVFALLAMKPEQDPARAMLWMVAGYTLAIVLPVRNPWRSDFLRLSSDEDRRPLGEMPRIEPDEWRGTAIMLRFLCGFGAFLLFWPVFSATLDGLEFVFNLDREIARRLVVLLLLVPLFLSGFAGVKAGAMLVIMLLALCVGLPALIELARWTSHLPDLAALQAALPRISVSALWPLFPRIGMQDGLQIVMGVMLGFASLVASARLTHRSTRLAASLGGFLIAILVGFAMIAGGNLLQIVLSSEIVGAMPDRWPYFVFDEAIRGWLSICGTFPADAGEVIRACAERKTSLATALAALKTEPSLHGAALALARGWPILLGFVWMLVTPLLSLIALGFLTHIAAVGLVESIAFRLVHPKALKAWRLSMMRLFALSLGAVAYVLDREGLSRGFSLSGTEMQWGIFSFALMAGVSVLAGWLIAITRAWNRFSARRSAKHHQA